MERTTGTLRRSHGAVRRMHSLLLWPTEWAVNVRALTDAPLGEAVEPGDGLRASGKAVWRWPSVVAAGAGAMQIQLGEGRGFRGAEAALRSMAFTVPRPELPGAKEAWRRWSLQRLERKSVWRKVGECGTRRGTRCFRVGESGFMPQRLTLEGNEVGSRQP